MKKILNLLFLILFITTINIVNSVNHHKDYTHNYSPDFAIDCMNPNCSYKRKIKWREIHLHEGLKWCPSCRCKYKIERLYSSTKMHSFRVSQVN